MSRPLYFTGRKDIARSDVTIRLIEAPGEATRFRGQCSLEGYRLPTEADVVIEAYHMTKCKRSFGLTVTRRDLERLYRPTSRALLG